VLHWIEDPRAPLPSGDDQVGIQALKDESTDKGTPIPAVVFPMPDAEHPTN